MNDFSKVAWYKQRWPWIVMSGPAVVVVAGIGTAIIAASTNDTLVTEDYYRQGLTINRVLTRERHAAEIGLAARLSFDGQRVVAELPGSAPKSSELRLSFAHPARAADDETIVLRPAEEGRYVGAMKSNPAGVVRIVLEDREGAWRLEGAMRDSPASVALGSGA